MIHIKTFENDDFVNILNKIKQQKIDEDEKIKQKISKLKKYIIYKDNIRLLIIELSKSDHIGKSISGEKIYLYKDNSEKLKRTKGFIEIDDINLIIFTSDSIVECVNVLLTTIINQIKYNI